MNPEQWAIIDSLSKNYPKRVKTYKPASWVAIQTVDVLLDVRLHPFLKRIYEYSDGFGILDYCLTGCANRKIMSIASDNQSLWECYPKLERRFIDFMGTSACESFGYLIDTIDGYNPVGYMQTDRGEDMLIISSSVERFFKLFIEEAEKTIVESKEGEMLLTIARTNWPMDLNFWFSRDEDLKVLYDKHKFPIPTWAQRDSL